jgi:hypothetical protein
MPEAFLVILSSCSLPLLISFLKQLENPSVKNMKGKDKRGSPCLRPLEREKFFFAELHSS